MSKRPTIKLAYADDHLLVRKSIIEHLMLMGHYRVMIEADNGQELLRQLAIQKTHPDICILDLYMPHMDGFETIRELRRHWPFMKVLILTGNETEFALIRMITAGANGYLLKSCGPDELGKALESIYHKGIYYSEHMTLDFFEAVKEGKVRLPQLKETEHTFLKYACSDMSYAQIAEAMNKTAKQVDWIRTCLFEKFKVMSRAGMAMFAIQSGMISLQGPTPTQHFH